MLALQSGIHFFDFESGRLTFIVNPHSCYPGFSLNDGKCDRRGRFWVGTMTAPLADLPCEHDEPASGYLFRLDPDLRCHKKRGGMLITNGIAWSPDDRTMYFGDSGRRMIFRAEYDLDEGCMNGVEPHIEFRSAGVPDGSTIDADGYLWTAEYGGARIIRYDPAGYIDRVIELPVTYPTSCTFGGESLDLLFITTSKWKLSPAQLVSEPLAGHLLVVTTNFRGLPEPAFAA